MFVNKRDNLRKTMNVNIGRDGETLVRKSHPRFVAPVPALGEMVQKTHDKQKDDESEMTVYSELVRLLGKRFIEPRYLVDGAGMSELLHEVLRREVKDDRDRISAMDALIVATAVTDPDCDTLFTTDSALTLNNELKWLADRWREDRGYPPFTIRNIDQLLAR